MKIDRIPAAKSACVRKRRRKNGEVVMDQSFSDILKEHEKRYPLMMPQDYGKLAYQSEFGPRHLLADETLFVLRLEKELEQLPEEPPFRSPERIGNGLCRFHLTPAILSRHTAALLTKLCLFTARDHSGTQAGFSVRLSALNRLSIPGMDPWLSDYRKQGYPPVHHSEVFRRAYLPHYRLLKREYAFFFPLFQKLWPLAHGTKTVVVAIDGKCGSGKTWLSEILQKLMPCNVFHMDDFYLPLRRRPEGWETIPCTNMDTDRFLKEVLVPAKGGKSIRFRPWQCGKEAPGEPVFALPRPLTVIEGSYSHHPDLSLMYDLRIFLTCSGDIQKKRIKRREGAYFPVFQNRWIPLEQQYFRVFRIEEKADFSVDTSDIF